MTPVQRGGRSGAAAPPPSGDETSGDAPSGGEADGRSGGSGLAGESGKGPLRPGEGLSTIACTDGTGDCGTGEAPSGALLMGWREEGGGGGDGDGCAGDEDEASPRC